MNEYYSDNTSEIKKKKLSVMGVIIPLFWLFALVPFTLITGAALIFIGSFEFDERRDCTYETDATIVDYFTEERHEDNIINYQYYPVYSYGYGENEYRAQGPQSLPEKKYKIGERTTVFVNPDNSEEFFDKNYSLLRADNNPFVVIFYIFSALLITDIVFFICYKKAYEAQEKESNNN